MQSVRSLIENVPNFRSDYRPLQDLTKAELFEYPDQELTAESGMTFMREVMARRAAFVDLQAEVDKAVKNVDAARIRKEHARENSTTAQKRLNELKELGADTQGERQLCEMAEVAAGKAIAWYGKQQEILRQKECHLVEDKAHEDVLGHDEVVAHYKRRFEPDWQIVIKQWKEEKLMHAQLYGWAIFLSATRDERELDLVSYRFAETVAMLTDRENDEDFSSMKAMYLTRVIPAIANRREFDKEGSGNITVGSMKPEHKQRYWRWWRQFNMATFKYKWPDPSGIAYDDRHFNPNDDMAKQG